MGRWSNTAFRITLASVLMIGSNGANAKSAESEVRLIWRLAPTDKAGSEKSGLACFPNGALLWREIAQPDSQLLHSRLLAVLESRGVGNASVGGEVTSLKAMICSPWLGMGAKPKSEIKLSVRWTIRSDSGTSHSASVETSVARKEFDLRIDPALLLEAVETSLQKALPEA
jgi:hypothetical protein